MISKRYFLHASGFDPYDAAAQYRRFAREAARFATTWNVTAQVSALQQIGASESGWTVTTRAPGWQVVKHGKAQWAARPTRPGRTAHQRAYRAQRRWAKSVP